MKLKAMLSGTSCRRRLASILSVLTISTSAIVLASPAIAQTTPAQSRTTRHINAQQVAETVATQGETTQTATSEEASDENASTRLQTVVVTATGFEQTVNDAPASITVIPREELEKGSFRDLGDALRNVQGVAVTGSAAEQDIFIRGLPGAYTLILVDGKRQSTRDARTNGNSGFEQSFVPPAGAIERIEVVRGPMSSLYGSDAMGGVINIITRKVPEKWTGTITIDGTANQHSEYGNSAQVSYYAAGPLQPDVIGLQLWGRGMGREEDAIVSGTPKKKEIDITGRVTVTPNKDHDLTFEAGTTKLKRFSTVGNNIERSVNNNRAAVDTYNLNTRDHLSFGYTGRLGWTTAEFSVLQETAKRESYTWNNNTQDFVANLRAPTIRNTIIDGKFTTPFSLAGNHTLVTGAQYIRNDLTDQNPGLRTAQDEKFDVTQWALFGEDEWWISNSFSLTGGLRMDHHEIYGTHWSPRGYAVWHATDNITLKGGISTGFRAPEIRQIAPGYAYTTGGGNCFYGQKPPSGRGRCGVIIGSSGLQPEKSTSYEFAALYDNLENLQLGATYFYTDFKDKISNQQVVDANGNLAEWSVDPNYVLWEFINIDDAVMQGVELTGTWSPIEAVSLRGNYTYTHSEQKTGDYKGLPLARTPEHMGSIRADWHTPVDGLDAWAGGNYHGKETNAGLRIGAAGTAVLRNGQVVAREYKDYFTFDIGGSYKFSDYVSLNAAVYNLFDKRVSVDEFNNVVEGRRLWVSMTSNF
ncbi:TonB-dependent receptor [Bartonella sp. HY406]|nr:TonB-dependent receptor [Bartonella sp. HY406]UXN03970.1 TonB-dependent receptor [Bartonella sp. HY406]